MISRTRVFACLVLPLIVVAFRVPAAAPEDSGLRITGFLPEAPLSRAGRPANVEAAIEYAGETPVTATLSLIAPEGIVCETPARVESPVGEACTTKAVWRIVAREPGEYSLRLAVHIGNEAAESLLTMRFLPPLEQQTLPYIPDPEPVQTDVLIGAHHCPLWEADKPFMWAQLIKHPERTPALGFYAQENPEVSDWETKWAVEHGVSFFIYCWYRASQGEPVRMNFGSAIHDALFKSRFVDKMKFTIMWENQAKGRSGVADENDLMTNLLPFWIDNYFKHPSYVKIDNKPLLFIYRPEFLIEDLGGVENVVKAFDLMRRACKEASFDGLYLLGEYRGLDPEHLKLMKSLGLDYTFAYCWHVADSPAPQRAIDTQLDYINKTQELGILPQVVTVSQGWSGWKDEGSIWTIPPEEYKQLLRRAKEVIATFPANELGSKLLLLDNWNEWGEGHFIAPYRQYGFGYLDAVREVLSRGEAPHTDYLPEDIGMGPYDLAYMQHIERQQQLRERTTRRVFKEGTHEEDLIAWWTFDDEDAELALDYSGNRQGGLLRDASRAAGVEGQALVCSGGCVEVPGNSRLSVRDELAISCWVNTDAAGQDNTWIVNRVYQGGTHTGYRLGVLEGKPCFEIPQTEWSHHLKASVILPTGRWVHLAGTFDGQTMRIYVDGVEQGSMERPGPINPNDFHLCIGNYDVGHASYFRGLVDEVKLYSRALSADEVAQIATP